MPQRPPFLRLKPGLVAGLLCFAAASASAQTAPVVPTVCLMLAASPWPSSLAERQRLVREMDGLTERCSGSAAFLALLGALWLEEGEPGQALLWLERSILLDPTLLSARVDHALALAALGEPAARNELLSALAQRSDVPATVLQRLRAARDAGATSMATNGRDRSGRWLTRGELSLRHGHDQNLDRSPVLDGITLTSPDGPVELPLAIPLRPRAGQASVVEAAGRVAYDTGYGALWQLSAALAARRASAEPGTDWEYAQVRADHWRAWGPWRTQVHVGAGRSTGPLNEPYSIYRLGAALERDWGPCTGRAALEGEARRQQTSSYLDGNLSGGLASLQCRLDGLSGWRLGAEARASTDRPVDAGRPGGSQSQRAVTIRLVGKLFDIHVEAAGLFVRARDQDGYSPLLQSNARRTFQQRQFQLELAYPLPASAGLPAELFLQWNDARQTSNIELFTDSGASAYGGIRWRW